jgi:two-component system NarL family response regulator
VLRHLTRGQSNRAVAADLGISENTVKNHVRSILEKLQAKSRAEAVVIGLRQGLTSLPG